MSSTHVRRTNRTLMLLAFCTLACAEKRPGESGGACMSHGECRTDAVLRPLGRCANKEAYCSDDLCTASCRRYCTMVSPHANPCDEGLVCTEAKGADPTNIEAYCTAVPIACETADECPLYLPATEGAWSCKKGFCTFPDFKFLADR